MAAVPDEIVVTLRPEIDLEALDDEMLDRLAALLYPRIRALLLQRTRNTSTHVVHVSTT